jgi:Uma2 family endonuclease
MIALGVAAMGKNWTVSESDVHRDVMAEVIETLRDHFADEPNVYVSGNIMVYYEEGNPLVFHSPDAFVVRGISNQPRNNFKTWTEHQAPEWVLEITSRTTQREDQDEKLTIYRENWKVREYFLFDPLKEWLVPSLQGCRLIGHEYQSIPVTEGLQLYSEVLELRLEREGCRLVFRNPRTGRIVLRREAELIRKLLLELELTEAKAHHVGLDLREALEAKKAAEAAVQACFQKRQQLAADVERLRRELEALKQPPPTP